MNINRFVFIMEVSIKFEEVKSLLTDTSVFLFANANGATGDVSFESVQQQNKNEIRCRVNIKTENKRMLSDESAYIETVKTVLLQNVAIGEIELSDIKIIKARIEEMLEEVPSLNNKKYLVFTDNDGYYYVKSKAHSSSVYRGFLKHDLDELLAKL